MSLSDTSTPTEPARMMSSANLYRISHRTYAWSSAKAHRLSRVAVEPRAVDAAFDDVGVVASRRLARVLVPPHGDHRRDVHGHEVEDDVDEEFSAPVLDVLRRRPRRRRHLPKDLATAATFSGSATSTIGHPSVAYDPHLPVVSHDGRRRRRRTRTWLRSGFGAPVYERRGRRRARVRYPRGDRDSTDGRRGGRRDALGGEIHVPAPLTYARHTNVAIARQSKRRRRRDDS